MLLCWVGLTVALPMAIAPEAQACSTVVAMAQESLRADSHRVERPLVEAFAPSKDFPKPQQSCHRQMDEVSREIVLAALRQADQIQDPAEKAQAIVELFWVYKHFELPSTFALLDRAQVLSREVEAVGQRLDLMMEIAQAYACSGADEAAFAQAQEAALMDEAWVLLKAASPNEVKSAEGAVHHLLAWYENPASQADSADKVAWLREQQQETLRANLLEQGLTAEEAEEYLAYFNAGQADSGNQLELIEQLQVELDQLSSAVASGNLAVVDADKVQDWQQQIQQLPSSSYQFMATLSLVQLLLQTEQFALAQDLVAGVPLSETFGITEAAELGLELDEDVVRSLTVMVWLIAESGHMPDWTAVDGLTIGDPHGPGLQAAVRILMSFQEAEQGEQAEARRLLLEATERLPLIEDSKDRAQVLVLLATANASQGEMERSEAQLAEALQLVPTLQDFADLMIAEVRQQAEEYSTSAAPSQASEELSESLDVQEKRLEAFHGAIDAENLDVAEALADQFEPDWERVDVLITLGALQSRLHSPALALESLAEANQLLQTLGDSEDSDVERLMYRILPSFSHGRGSVALLPDLLTLISDVGDREAARLSVLEGWYLQSDQPNHLQETRALMTQVNRLPNSATKTELWNRWLTDFATAGAWSDAMAHLQQLPVDAAQVEKLTELAVAYSRLETAPDDAVGGEIQAAARRFGQR